MTMAMNLLVDARGAGGRMTLVPPAPGSSVPMGDAALGAAVTAVMAGESPTGEEHVWDSWISPTGGRYRRVGRYRGSRVRPLRSVEGVDVPMVPSLTLAALFLALGLKKDGGVTGAVGMDLSLRAHEVRKLFYAGGFTRTLVREGIDPEDFLQEVYRGLLARNKGTCPWDAKKSSFGHYVHIVIKCVLSNYLRKERRRSSMEEVTSDGEVKGGTERGNGGTEDFHQLDLLRDLFPDEGERGLAGRLVGRMEAGRSRKEAALDLGVAVPVVDGMLRRMRQGLQG